MIKSRNIFLHFNELDQETKDIFKDFCTKENPMLMPGEVHWVPDTDIYETRTGIVVKIELCGVGQDKIDIMFKNNTITQHHQII